MKYFILFLITFSSVAEAKTILLKSGETRSIATNGKIWIENPKVLQVKQTATGITIKGIRPGSSLVKTGSQTLQIQVISPLQEKTIGRLEKAVKKTLGLQLVVTDGAVRIRGRLLRWEDWDVVYESCQPDFCKFQMEADINPNLTGRIENSLEKKMRILGLSPQKILFGKPYRVLLSSKSPHLTRLKQTFGAFGVEPHVSEDVVDLLPLIKVQITVAEVKRAESVAYGVQWPASFQAQLIPKYLPATDNQPWTVHALESQGLAKVLATPTLLCRSGKEASFLAGGEFPIKIVNYKTQDVIWRKYGIILKISPIADYSGKMSIAIETEVSSLDNSNKVDGLPGLFTNRIQTHFDLSEPRTLALSGLIKNEDSKTSQGLPGLSRIPIIGSLFGSQDFRENRTELVIFVRPEIVSPGSLEVNE